MALTDNESKLTDHIDVNDANGPQAQNQPTGFHESTSLPPQLDDSKQSDHHAKHLKTGLARSQYLTVIIILIVSGAAGFLGGWLGVDSHSQNASSTTPFSSKQTVVSSQSARIAQIAQTVGQSVVSVDATQSATGSGNTSLLGLGSGGSSEDAGTGIILSANGLIITNRHVIPDGTTSVSVTLSDGTTYNNVQVVGRTSDSDSLDIAFLQINNLNGKKLTPATIGDSSQTKVGDAVVAIGNALGQFQNTVTSGIISGYGRSVQASDSTGSTSENLDDLFQTDAAINEGNSGGPLVNLSGQVIGINTAIASNSQNIGFAIPINDVTGLIKSVEQTGKLQQPYLGVIYIPITSDVAQQYNLKVSQGAWVPPSDVVGQAAVVAGGPADQAGIKSGDIITAINGQQINQNTSLTSIIDKQQVGDSVTLTVNRNGQTVKLKATLGTAPTGDTTTNG
ncbi:MAG TPA: trypsin-like peptidase domain-containing protein [Candidatus Saccharimonadales bacterium]|nr:trypsin-like peptidase domain-containing protein [Candidatus Saccharimonadales bacterium]